MLKGYKTYITGTLAILTAVGAYLAGDMAAAQAIELGLNALMVMFLRNGIPTK